MPATAGRTAMPRGNRMDTSASLRTTGIWANTIGYDPYAPTAEAPGAGAAPAENVYEKSKGLLAAARLTGGVEVDTGRGQWKGSGRLKGMIAPGRGMPDEPAAAPVVTAPLEAPAGEDSDSELSSDSESARRRQRKAAKADKKRHKHSRSKKHRRSDSGSDRSSSSDERRRRKRSEDKADKREKKARKKARKERKPSPSSSSD